MPRIEVDLPENIYRALIYIQNISGVTPQELIRQMLESTIVPIVALLENQLSYLHRMKILPNVETVKKMLESITEGEERYRNWDSQVLRDEELEKRLLEELRKKGEMTIEEAVKIAGVSTLLKLLSEGKIVKKGLTIRPARRD